MSGYEDYFGKPLIPIERADNALSHETYNLPKAYEGKNKHLEDVLDFMIRKEDEFYTNKLLPWTYTEDLHVQWEIFRFNRTLMDVEPEQGIPRLVTAETERRSDNLLRRGLAFIIEHGFMTTERGRRHYMMNLQQITDSVHTTAYYGVMHALLSSKLHYKAWLRETDRTSKRPRNLLRRERDAWACVQKSHKGLYVLDAELKHQMKKNNVVPNVWVFPPKMSIYLDMAPQEETEYRLKGPKAAGNLEEDRSQQAIRWRGTEVFEASTFDIDFVNDNHDLLQRPRQCGEFFVIPAGTKSIKIFSADHDDFMKIDYSDAWSHALNKDYQDAETGSDDRTSMEGPTAKIVREEISFGVGPASWHRFETRVGGLITGAFHKMIDPKIKKATTQLNSKNKKDVEEAEALLKEFTEIRGSYAGAREKCRQIFNGDVSDYLDDVNEIIEALVMSKEDKTFWCCTEKEAIEKVKQQLKKSMDAKDYEGFYLLLFGLWHRDELEEVKRQENYNETRLAKDILIFRPFQAYHMSSAILAAGGKDLGETFHGHHDFQLSDDIVRKVHVGHYTHYSKSVVKQPKRYAVAEDVFAQGYISGEGIEFFDEDTLRESLTDGRIGTDECSKSLIAWVIDPGSAADKTVLDMRGKFSEMYSEYGKSDFTDCDVLDAKLTECQLESGEEQHDDVFLSTNYSDNTICFRGVQYDETRTFVDSELITTTRYDLTHNAHGHWKDLTYRGCMSVREGTIIKPSETGLLQTL